MEKKKSEKKIVNNTKKTVKKTKTKKVTPKAKPKKKKGAFTLVELLAVIIILGVIMIIAIPSVTKYISGSRDRSYVATANEFVSGARVMVNSGELNTYNPDVTYYIPISCIGTENNAPSPYGDWKDAYVVVTYDRTGYSYYWTSIDEAKQGIYLTSTDQLDTSKIVRSAKDLNTGIAISGHNKVSILDKDTCTSFSEPSNSVYQMPAQTSLTEEQYEDANQYIVVYINDKSYSFEKNKSWYALRSTDRQVANEDSVRINTKFHSYHYVGSNPNVGFCVDGANARTIAGNVYKARNGVTGTISGGSMITCVFKVVYDEIGQYDEKAVLLVQKSITDGEFSGLTYKCAEKIRNSSNTIQSIYSKPTANAHYHTDHECDDFTLVDIVFTT